MEKFYELVGIISLVALITVACTQKVNAAEYNPIEFNSNAAYGSTQWQIDRANWNIINNNKYSTYQVQTETENRVNMDKYIQGQVDKERTDRVNMDSYIQSQVDTNKTNLTNQLTKETNERKAEDLRIKNSVEQNRQGLNEMKTKVSENQKGLNDLKPKVSNNTKAIEGLNERVTNNKQSIEGLKQSDAAQRASINQLKEVDTQLQNALNRNSEAINNNAKVIKQLNTRIDGLEYSVNKLDNKIETGLATVSALTALHPNPRYKGHTQIAIGAGMYADNVAGAIGVFHWVNDRVMLNAGASYGGDSSFAGNCGISIGL